MDSVKKALDKIIKDRVINIKKDSKEYETLHDAIVEVIESSFNEFNQHYNQHSDVIMEVINSMNRLDYNSFFESIKNPELPKDKVVTKSKKFIK